MTHPVRRLIKIVEGRLNELTDVDAGGKPPVAASDEPGRRRGQGGEFWFHQGKKIAVAGKDVDGFPTDFAVVPLLHYREFGFNPNALMKWLEQTNAHTAQAFRRYLQSTNKEPKSEIEAGAGERAYQEKPGLMFSFLGARDAGIMYAITQGWALIRYDEQQAVLWLDASHAKAVVQNAGSMFPMMSMEKISLVLPAQKTAFVNKTIDFYREDSSSFSGAFGALMQWANGGHEPEQSWLYAILRSNDETPLDDQGLHPAPGQYVRTGNWTDRNVYALKFYSRATANRAMRPGDRVYRFPASIVPALNLESGGDAERMLFSKTAFVIPASIIQKKTVAGWTALNASAN